MKQKFIEKLYQLKFTLESQIERFGEVQTFDSQDTASKHQVMMENKKQQLNMVNGLLELYFTEHTSS